MGTIADKLAYTGTWVNDAYAATIEKGGNITMNSDITELGAAIRGLSTDLLLFLPTTLSVSATAGTFTLQAAASKPFTITTSTFGVSIGGLGVSASFTAGIHSITISYPTNSESSSRHIILTGQITGTAATTICDIAQEAAIIIPPIDPCEGDDGLYVIMFPHETDPTKYYRCDWGTPVLQECPAGLWFNPCLGVCDFPENAMDCPDFGFSED